MTVFAYAVSGFCAGAAAVLYTARLYTGSPQLVENEVLMDCIGAAVIGGTSLFGGRGRIGGTLLGALFIALVGQQPEHVGAALLARDHGQGRRDSVGRHVGRAPQPAPFRTVRQRMRLADDRLKLSGIRIPARREDVLPDAGLGGRQLSRACRPGAGPGRRERRGQVDADERPGRRPAAGRGRDAVWPVALLRRGRRWKPPAAASRGPSGIEPVRQPEHRREPVPDGSALPAAVGCPLDRPPRTSPPGGRGVGDGGPGPGSGDTPVAQLSPGRAATGRDRQGVQRSAAA